MNSHLRLSLSACCVLFPVGRLRDLWLDLGLDLGLYLACAQGRIWHRKSAARSTRRTAEARDQNLARQRRNRRNRRNRRKSQVLRRHTGKRLRRSYFGPAQIFSEQETVQSKARTTRHTPHATRHPIRTEKHGTGSSASKWNKALLLCLSVYLALYLAFLHWDLQKRVGWLVTLALYKNQRLCPGFIQW